MGMIKPNQELRVNCKGNVSIHCRCYGQGEKTVVLLHGNGEDYTCFQKQLEPFAAQYRVLAIDSRGHGSSGMGEPFSLRVMADDVLTVMDALKVEKAMLLGFSDGGNVALYFALQYPSRLEKLVLVGANLFPGGIAPKVQQMDRIVFSFLQFMGRFSAKAMQKARIVGLMVTEPDIDPWELECIEVPALVIVGQKDMIQEEHTKLISSSIPKAKLRIVPSCDHFVLRNQPEWANTVILKFLSRER